MTREYLRGRLARLRGRPAAAPAGWTERDHRIVRRFAVAMVAGGTVLTAAAAIDAVPALAGFAIRLYQGMVTGSLSSPAFWNSLVIAAGLMAQVSLLLVLRVRDRRGRPDPAAAEPA
jgi:hypothetical protein